MPLLYRLASDGWLCISANYRLRAAGRFPNSLIDAKAVIARARAHAAEHGANPALIVVAGGSAGGHLASMTALTPNHPAFQPAGVDVDTSVAAAVCLCGFYAGGHPASLRRPLRTTSRLRRPRSWSSRATTTTRSEPR
jgi:acetyl esterase/lipase